MSREQQHLHTYLDLFVHRRDLYAQQTCAGAYFLRSNQVTDDVVRAHLRGTITAGWYALTPDNTTRWVVLDADRADGLEQLQGAWKQLEAKGISSQLERSRRGGHLWIPFEPIPAHVARHLVLGLLPDLEGVEVFPKRDRLDEDTRVGNLMRGPLGIHRLTGERYPFVDPISLIPHQPHRFRSEFGRIGSMCRPPRHSDSFPRVFTPQCSGVHRTGSTPQPEFRRLCTAHWHKQPDTLKSSGCCRSHSYLAGLASSSLGSRGGARYRSFHT